MKKGLKYVYVGNVHDRTGQTTYCPSCHKSLIVRNWHEIVKMGIHDSKCDCGEKIPIIWN